jgi:hypothetical protein
MRLGPLGGGDPLEDADGQREPGCAGDRLGSRGDELGVDRPPGGDRLADQPGTLDDEGARVGTRTAAPQEAPQLEDLGILEGQRFVQGTNLP